MDFASPSTFAPRTLNSLSRSADVKCWTTGQSANSLRIAAWLPDEMSVVIKTNCSLPLLRWSVCRPTNKTRARNTKGKRRSTFSRGVSGLIESIVRHAPLSANRALSIELCGTRLDHADPAGTARALQPGLRLADDRRREERAPQKTDAQRLSAIPSHDREEFPPSTPPLERSASRCAVPPLTAHSHRAPVARRRPDRSYKLFVYTQRLT